MENKNDLYCVLYCNNMIGTFNDLKTAIDFVENCKNNEWYLQKNEFSIYVKTSI